MSGTYKEINEVADWLDKQTQFKHKIVSDFIYSQVIAGNHDLTLDEYHYNDHLAKKFHRHFKVPEDPKANKARIMKSCHYLENSGVEIEGYKFWGSPCSLEFCDWGFPLKPGKESAQFWQ